MNIQRVNSGIQGPAQQRSPGRDGIDLTISEGGVDFARADRAAVGGNRLGEAQVASSPSLQAVLSAEEVRALAANFSPSSAAAPGTADGGSMSIYNGRGTRVSVRAGEVQGRLLDIRG